VLVGEPAQLLRPLAAGVGADRGDPLLGPLRTLAPDRLDQGRVYLEDVVVDQGRCLVEDLVGLPRTRSLDGCHPIILAGDPVLS
jgi:hypothetical protein